MRDKTGTGGALQGTNVYITDVSRDGSVAPERRPPTTRTDVQ